MAKPKSFLAYLKRDRQNLYSVATVWVVLTAIWLLFPAMADPDDRYGRSLRVIVIWAWPVWLVISFVVYKGWLKSTKRKSGK